MGQETKIEWCDHTASPWHGCTKVAAGCVNCDAERQAKRNPGTLGIWGDNGTRVKSKSFVKNLRLWNKQGKAEGRVLSVFPSICDPFEDRPELVPWRQEMFSVIDECPWVRLLLLTKRPENVQRMTPAVEVHCQQQADDRNERGELFRRNVWLGTSISTQADADRNIPLLLKCRDLSPVLFVSAEPLLGPIDLTKVGNHDGTCANLFDGNALFVGDIGWPDFSWTPRGFLRWAIIGGESGPNARPCRPEWIRSLVRQCRDAGVPPFVKQMGRNVIARNDQIEGTNGADGWPDPEIEYGGVHSYRAPYQGADCRINLRDPKGGDWSEWPEDLRVREFPAVCREGTEGV